MTLFYTTLALIGTLVPILAEEAETAAETHSTMGPTIWIVLMVLAVILVGVVWAAANRIKPPAVHNAGHGSTHADSH